MRKLLLLFIALSNVVFGADSDDLVGTWKLVSWQVITANGPPQNVFGNTPKGLPDSDARRAHHGADHCREATAWNGRCGTSSFTEVNACLQG
jgi:hypothetical protein